MQMRPSRVLRKLRAGKLVSCFKINIVDPSAAEIAAMSGFDCVWVDMEHVPCDWAELRAQIMAAKLHDVDTMVRVERGSYSDYIKPFELDATGIMVPHVISAEDCRQVTRMTRFHPVGRRPIDGGNADGGYCTLEMSDYIAQASRERFVSIQIEDPEGLDELEGICATEGVDMIFYGPGDFSHGAGIPGQIDHPKIAEARKRIAEAAIRHGKCAGTIGGPQKLDELIALGYRFISMGADVVGLGQYCRTLAAEFGKRAVAK